MPQPTRGDVHVNRPLTNISIAYIQDAKNFIADQVFPNVPVLKQADRYFSYTKDFWFRTNAQKRAPGAESAGAGFGIDNTPTYFCDVWAEHVDVDDQTRTNADMPLDLDRDATMFVTQGLLLRREIEFMRTFMGASIWTGASDTTPSIKWDAATGDPMLDVDNMKSDIKAKTGFMPNTFVVTNDVFFALRNNKYVLDRIKYTQRGVVTEEILAALFGVDKFLVSGAVLNSAQEGITASMNYLVTNCALLCYANPSPSILQPSAGYTFGWQGLFGAGALGNRIKSFRIEKISSDRIEGEMAFDMKLVGADLGGFFTSILT